MSQETYYLNWWGPDDVNRHDWQEESQVDITQPGMYEVSLYPPGSEPTPEQLKAAQDLLERTWQAAIRHNWFNINQAFLEGYSPYDSTHFINMDYVYDEDILNPDKPENLMYYTTRTGPKFVGVMYLLPKNTMHGPQIGGPLTVWHFHIDPKLTCWDVFPDHEPKNGHCMMGEADVRSAEMIHVWFLKLPDGPFTSNMTIPEDIFELLG